ncbi:MAG: hypothetical protein M0Q53_21095, partial [Prolixibacteraceae bacterium]|nr:hypothetical protein [Prolixibacteraceae bacterium]
MKIIRIISLACLLGFLSTQLYAYTEKNLLQHKADLSVVKTSLIMDQKWVPYPSYADRTGWDKFLGENKAALIARGEKLLNYPWKVVKATDYIEYERSGNRKIME